MTDSPDAMTTSSSTASTRMQDALRRLWLKNEATLQQRVQAIRRAYEALSGAHLDDQQLDDEVRIEARDAAHKLAGVLGTFGLPRGTDLAREAEVMLDAPEKFDTERSARLASLLVELETMLADKSKELGELSDSQVV